jgi:hypothetical protein
LPSNGSGVSFPEISAAIARATRSPCSSAMTPASIESARRIIYWAIRCAEGWSRDDPAEIVRIGAESDFLETALREAHLQALVCTLLGEPLPAPDTGVVPRTTVPVLFVVGGMDPQDSSCRAAATFPYSSAACHGSPCVSSIPIAYRPPTTRAPRPCSHRHSRRRRLRGERGSSAPQNLRSCASQCSPGEAGDLRRDERALV